MNKSMINRVLKPLALTMAVTIGVCITGCSQDEGNYDYHSLNEPSITGVPEQISVLIHDNVDIDPSLGSNITDLNAYTYEWKVINNTGDNEVTLLSHEKHLNEKVTLSKGKYVFSISN